MKKITLTCIYELVGSSKANMKAFLVYHKADPNHTSRDNRVNQLLKLSSNFSENNIRSNQLIIMQHIYLSYVEATKKITFFFLQKK